MSDQAPQHAAGGPRSDVERVAARQAAFLAAGLDAYGQPLKPRQRAEREQRRREADERWQAWKAANPQAQFSAPALEPAAPVARPESAWSRVFWWCLGASRWVLVAWFVAMMVPATQEVAIAAWGWVFGVVTCGIGPVVLMARFIGFGIDALAPRRRYRR